MATSHFIDKGAKAAGPSRLAAMTIGQAAAASGVSAKMIRYYEETDLIRSATRSAGGYRHYDDADVHTLRFVRRSRDLGFSVEQIAALLALWRDRGRASAEVKALAMEHVRDLQGKIADLQAMVGTLTTLAAHCGGDGRPQCPIIDDLAASDAGGLQRPLAAVGGVARAGLRRRGAGKVG